MTTPAIKPFFGVNAWNFFFFFFVTYEEINYKGKFLSFFLFTLYYFKESEYFHNTPSYKGLKNCAASTSEVMALEENVCEDQSGRSTPSISHSSFGSNKSEDNNTNDKRHPEKPSSTPDSFRTKYSFPPLRYEYGYSPMVLTAELFKRIDHNVCMLYAKFNSQWEKLQKLCKQLQTTDLKTEKYSNLYQQYRSLEMEVADLHVDIEASVTLYESMRGPAKNFLSIWQKKRLLKLHKELSDVQGGNVEIGGKSDEVISMMQTDVAKVKKCILIPKLPQESPGNKLKILLKLLPKTVEPSTVIFLTRKIAELKNMQKKVSGE